ncbi:hypothetical protein BDZ97DRAFT_1754173 [Flammula alnicola]|nr:hypothetical protein BDZ97DRAFT_1754173 [Flammula alnicola]
MPFATAVGKVSGNDSGSPSWWVEARGDPGCLRYRGLSTDYIDPGPESQGRVLAGDDDASPSIPVTLFVTKTKVKDFSVPYNITNHHSGPLPSNEGCGPAVFDAREIRWGRGNKGRPQGVETYALALFYTDLRRAVHPALLIHIILDNEGCNTPAKCSDATMESPGQRTKPAGAV